MNATTNANAGKNAKGALPPAQRAILSLIHAFIYVKNTEISEAEILERVKQIREEDQTETAVSAVATYAEELEVDQRFKEIFKDANYDFSQLPDILEELTMENADELIKPNTSLKLNFDDEIVIEVVETEKMHPNRTKYGVQYDTEVKTLWGTHDDGKPITEGAKVKFYLPKVVLDAVIAYCKEKGFKTFKGVYKIVCSKQTNGNRAYTCKALELTDLAELGLLEEPTE